MEANLWYDVFLELIHEKYPKNAQLTHAVMDLLCLEREATYRRLRKEVPFTANEIAKMATTWKISLDEIIGINSGKISFQMHPFNYLNPSPKELNNMQKVHNLMEQLRAATNSEYMEVSNIFPRPLDAGFPSLLRFKIFNWAYYYNGHESPKPFSNVILPNSVRAAFEHYKSCIVHIKNSNFILDEMVFEHFVQNIHYFHSILMITNEEKELIKEELHALLDYMLEIANRGYYPETQNQVNIYTSQITINTNYSYIYTEKLKTCRIHAFGKFDISSYDSQMVENFRDWMNLKKKSSILISEVNEKKRIEFFGEQRRIVDGL
ncbi:MAG: hypothetical protein FWD09_06705 [Lentimicrobiaceae bacterium]|nr:hypothetical protein [Lentimicrobiaceae bacterium]